MGEAIGEAIGEATARGCGPSLVHVCDSSAYGLWTTTRTVRAGLRALSQPIIDDAIGDRPTGQHALSFAVREAALRAVPLLAVHAWLVPAWPQSEPDGSTTDPAFEIGREQGLLNSALAAHRGPLAAADVHRVIRSGRATQVLMQSSRPGDLLVMGQHRHGRFVPATPGPVVSALVHQPPCAIAIAIVPEPVVQLDQNPSEPVALVAVP